MKIMKKKCPRCGKVINSIYEKQLEYNYKAHLLSCEDKENELKSEEKQT